MTRPMKKWAIVALKMVSNDQLQRHIAKAHIKTSQPFVFSQSRVLGPT